MKTHGLKDLRQPAGNLFDRVSQFALLFRLIGLEEFLTGLNATILAEAENRTGTEERLERKENVMSRNLLLAALASLVLTFGIALGQVHAPTFTQVDYPASGTTATSIAETSVIVGGRGGVRTRNYSVA
jgi:hypothetical protein